MVLCHWDKKNAQSAVKLWARPKWVSRGRSQAMGNSVTSLCRIFRKNLGLYSYKIKLTQELNLLDHQQRSLFVNWTEQQLEKDSSFHRKIIFIDGFVNKQNIHYWLQSNLKTYGLVRFMYGHWALLFPWWSNGLGNKYGRQRDKDRWNLTNNFINILNYPRVREKWHPKRFFYEFETNLVILVGRGSKNRF